MAVSSSEVSIVARIDFDTKKLASKISARGSQLIRKIILDGMRQLIRQSPVDMGRFKANWSTSITNMSEGTTKETKVNMSKQTNEISNYKLGQTAFLHNNLEYATPLEYGTSKQAPAGWVRNTAKEMQRIADKIKGLI